MNFESENFHFALEMIIAGRNENGASLGDIRDDYYNVFGRTLESMLGDNWAANLQDLLLNRMNDIKVVHPPGGYTLFFIKVAKLRVKLLALKGNADIQAILHKLKIDPQNLKSHRGYNDQSQSSFNSIGMSSASNSSSGIRPAPSTSAEFYGHTLIADNFFLELSKIDLHYSQKSGNRPIDRIGLCISGLTIKIAYRTIVYGQQKCPTSNVILNIGTFDLLNGRTAENMIEDIGKLVNGLQRKNLQPIFTTLAPLPNHVGDAIDERRQSFNKFIRENFDVIDIEKCFLSNEKRVLRECYQPDPKTVIGSKHSVILWNRIGRQRVLQLMKQEIPYIHQPFF